jgi:hypothetical protein
MSDKLPRLTRQQAVAFLNQNGFPISLSTLERLCMPSRGEGPPVDLVFNGRPLYRPDDVLAWAEARSQPGTKVAA